MEHQKPTTTDRAKRSLVADEGTDTTKRRKVEADPPSKKEEAAIAIVIVSKDASVPTTTVADKPNPNKDDAVPISGPPSSPSGKEDKDKDGQDGPVKKQKLQRYRRSDAGQLWYKEKSNCTEFYNGGAEDDKEGWTLMHHLPITRSLGKTSTALQNKIINYYAEASEEWAEKTSEYIIECGGKDQPQPLREQYCQQMILHGNMASYWANNNNFQAILNRFISLGRITTIEPHSSASLSTSSSSSSSSSSSL
jgi:hypothetical protein